MKILDRIFGKHDDSDEEPLEEEDQTTVDFEESRAEKKAALAALRTKTQTMRAVHGVEDTNPGINIEQLRHAEG
jgi:hypothetical protein